MPFLVALSLLFIALKLLAVIAWSWWLVLMPLYIIPVIIILSLTSYLAVLLAKVKS